MAHAGRPRHGRYLSCVSETHSLAVLRSVGRGMPRALDKRWGVSPARVRTIPPHNSDPLRGFLWNVSGVSEPSASALPRARAPTMRGGVSPHSAPVQTTQAAFCAQGARVRVGFNGATSLRMWKRGDTLMRRVIAEYLIGGQPAQGTFLNINMAVFQTSSALIIVTSS